MTAGAAQSNYQNMLWTPARFDRLKEIAYALCDFENHDLRCWHVSFLMRRNKILSIGVNKRCTHTINLRNRKVNKSGIDFSDKKFQCSEFTTLQKSRSQNINYSKCRMVNIRIDRNNKLGISAPCQGCLSLLAFHSIKDVYYSTNQGTFEKL